MDRWPWHLSSAKAWPASTTTLKTGIAKLLAEADRHGIRVRWNGASGVRISSSPFTRRADVERVDLDLTGAEIEIDAAKASASPATLWVDADGDEIVERTPGVIGTARVSADPVRIDGHEVRAELTLENAPVEWIVVRRGDALLGTIAEGHDRERRAGGTFRFSMRQDDLASLIEGVLRGALRSSFLGIPLTSFKSLRLAITPTGPERFTIACGVAFRLYALTFSARAGVDVEIQPDGSVTVHRAAVASRRLLSKLALLPLRGRIARLNERTFDIADDELKVHDLRIDAAHERLTVSGRIRSR